MKRLYIVVAILVVLGIAGYLAFPSVANAKMRSRVEEKLRMAFGDRVKFARIETDFSGKRARIFEVELLQPDPQSKHNPLVKAAEADIVFESVVEKHANATSLKLKDCVINAVVDSRGEASFAKFIREKPRSGRTWEVRVDDMTVENLTINTFIAPREKAASEGVAAKPGGPVPDQPTSVLTVKGVHALGFILPPERTLLGREAWISTEIQGVELTPTAIAGAKTEPCIKIASIKFELTQAPSTDEPVRIRKFQLHQPEMVTFHDGGDRKSDMRIAVVSVQKAFGLKEPKEFHDAEAGRPMPAGLIIEDVHTTDARIESRGTGPDGEMVYFRLQNANVEGGSLAFGPRVNTANPGFLKVHSATESTNGAGTAEINITNIQGTYPKVTFQSDYHASNVPANAFTSGGAGNGETKVTRGSLGLSFSGGAQDGNLSITGSVTLSGDFDISGSQLKKSGLKLVRDEPISPVEVYGTIEHPQVRMPSSIAMLSNIFGNIVIAAPVVILDSTVGQIPVVGEVVTVPVKEAAKGFKKVGDFFQGK